MAIRRLHHRGFLYYEVGFLIKRHFLTKNIKIRRIRDHSKFISNSVAISFLAPITSTSNSNKSSPMRDIRTMQYFWRMQSTEGYAESIFSRIESSSQDCPTEKTAFWPFSGIPIYSKQQPPPQQVKLLIVGQLVCRDPLVHAEITALSFNKLSMVLVVVSNPYDPPDSWDYSFTATPALFVEGSGEGLNAQRFV